MLDSLSLHDALPISRDQLLRLAIDRVAHPGIRLAAAPLGEVVQLRASEVAPEEAGLRVEQRVDEVVRDRKSTRLNSSHMSISYAVFCLKNKINSNE